MATLVTNEGTVTGTTIGSVARFANIPFAKPPERWSPPEPPEQYPNGTRDGTEFGPNCVELDGSGSEDCLLLNVFAPASAIGQPSAKLPVLVWVHGGAYQSGGAKLYDATNLVEYLDGKAIVVSINYRLHIFGFLGSPSLRSSVQTTGNWGILDQRRAFDWIRTNAAHFGGDPKSLTVFGESAGAGSISVHLAMPGSAHSFDRAILESGSFASWSARPLSHAEGIYQQVLQVAGCMDSACLATRSVANLTAAVNTLPLCCNNVTGNPYGCPWAPTIDHVELFGHPYTLARNGNLSGIPILHGTNLDEGASFCQVGTTCDEKTLVQLWIRDYQNVMGPRPDTTLYNLYLKSNVTYPNAPKYGSRPWWAAQRSLTDQAFDCPARMLSTYASASRGTPVWQYLFKPSTLPVVHHGDEVPFVFQSSYLKGKENIALGQAMAEMWYTFAATGTPRPPKGVSSWPQAKGGSYLSLDVGEGGIKVATAFRRDCGAFFDEWLARELR